jgi:hypothetical protein
MASLSCETVRLYLALGDRVGDRDVEDHIAGCPACAAEAVQMRRIVGAFDHGIETPVPGPLDLQVRAMIVPLHSRSTLSSRRRVAIAIGVAALLSIVAAIAGWHAKSGALDEDFWNSMLLVWIYLMLSGAATIPILSRHGILRAQRIGGLSR